MDSLTTCRRLVGLATSGSALGIGVDTLQLIAV
jgi:hypothetical protein